MHLTCQKIKVEGFGCNSKKKYFSHIFHLPYFDLFSISQIYFQDEVLHTKWQCSQHYKKMPAFPKLMPNDLLKGVTRPTERTFEPQSCSCLFGKKNPQNIVNFFYHKGQGQKTQPSALKTFRIKTKLNQFGQNGSPFTSKRKFAQHVDILELSLFVKATRHHTTYRGT